MSWEAQGWVWALPDLTPNERLVGLALANYANDLGEKIYPGQERIQAQTGLSESSVRRSIQSLVSSGWLIVVTKGDGRGHATEYRMPVDMQIVADRHAELKGVKSAPPNPERVSHRRKKGVTQTEKGCHTDAPILYNNLSDNLSDTTSNSERACRLPDGWIPSPDDRDYADKLGLDTAAVAENFRDYWHAKAGKGATKAGMKGWSLTWRGWCRRDAQNTRPRKPALHSAPKDKTNWAAHDARVAELERKLSMQSPDIFDGLTIDGTAQ